MWTVDPSLFPDAPDYEGAWVIPRLAPAASAPAGATPAPPAPAPQPAPVSRFRSNVPSRGNRPFVGRDDVLASMRATLGEPVADRVLVLHGPPGVGKSELAREFARQNRERYPGGTFSVDASASGPLVGLARIGVNALGLDFPDDLSIQDQCEQTLLQMATAPTLLIYDNVASVDSVERWLPPAGMPCHVLITTWLERWDPAWAPLAIEPLSRPQAEELVERLAGRAVAERWGAELAVHAGGLPVQICPAAVSLAYEARRGRLGTARLDLAPAARTSFALPYERLEPEVQLVLHAAAFLNCQSIPRRELSRELEEAGVCTRAEVERHLDTCLDLHLLDADAQLRMHQLFARFVLERPLEGVLVTALARVREVQRQRVEELAQALAEHPANSELATTLLGFPVAPEAWDKAGVSFGTEAGEALGRALYEIGHFDEARPWFERAVEAKQKGDVHGRVDHASLGRSLHQVGYCLSSTGKYDEARPWYERAVEATQKGDVHGRVDHASLRVSLLSGADCLRRLGCDDEAAAWEQRAGGADT